MVLALSLGHIGLLSSTNANSKYGEMGGRAQPLRRHFFEEWVSSLIARAERKFASQILGFSMPECCFPGLSRISKTFQAGRPDFEVFQVCERIFKLS